MHLVPSHDCVAFYVSLRTLVECWNRVSVEEKVGPLVRELLVTVASSGIGSLDLDWESPLDKQSRGLNR